MKCKFCYATFEDMHVGPQLSKEDAFLILDKLKSAGVQKITFAGGEPLLYRYIKDVIVYSKQIGLTTSIITNGSLLTIAFLNEMRQYLDWIGISIDSTNEETNISIGRYSKMAMGYHELIKQINLLGYRLKINTVVNRFNYSEDFSDLLNYAKPDRWKVFQTLRVEGQNETQFEGIKCTAEQFKNFTERHSSFNCLVPEDNAAMTGSYLLIDPLGRVFENSKGRHTYSDTLIITPLHTALSQVDLDRTMFVKRGGIYNW